MENITDIVNIDQTYQQPIQSSTNVSHETAIRNVLENAFNSQTEAYNDEKERIKVIIIEEITERKSNLLQVKNCIEREYEKSLSSIDNAYIEQKYMKYCTELWMEKVTALVQATTECNDTKLIQTILSSIDKIKTLSDIPESFKQLEYYKNLVDHYHFISENKKKNLISQFKEECLVPIFAYSATAQKESIFLEAFVDLLSSSRNIQSIINKLRLADFCMGEIYFDDLIDIILKYKGDNFNEKLTILQKASTKLKNEENFFLLDKFKEVISGYIKPIKIEEKIIDNRQVIEVIRNNINITEILTQLEVLLKKKSSIEEVRFIGADVMHIGTNLDSEVWKGKNIIILTKALKIHNKVLWNVSGNNNLHFYKNNAGVTYNGTPGDGSDGYPGESGGNVLILVNKIENPENFTIISNGGNGSVGQDGGDGKNGVDGKGIINSDFCEKFPPVSKLFCYSRWKNVEKTISSIKSDLQEIKIGWYRDWTFCDPYTKNVFNDIHDAIIADGDIFLNTITEQGNEITFSYQAPNLFYNCQSFLLYKGSLGKPGSPGGRNGIGGQGGYPGDIIVRNVATNQQILVTTQSKEGTAGKNGKAGKYGNHGKNGWDMGYIDYSIGDKWPKIFGTDQNSKLMLKYHEDNSSERVHCPYKIDNYDKYSYVEITSSNIMDKKETKYEERNSDELNRNRQHHAQAVRKKNISQSNIEANYSVYCNNTTDKNSIKSMQLEIEKINQQIRQAMTENQEAQKNQTTESKIECKWKFIKQKDYNYKERKDLKRIIRSDRTDRKSIQDLLNEVKCPQSNFDNWFHLQDIEIKIDEINEFLSYFEIWKSEILKKGSKLTNTQNKLKEIELLLIDKYRFATLQVIAMQLVSHNKVKSKIELTAETVLKYLVKDKIKNNDISHSILGTLSQYLYEDKKEQREKIVNYCETDLLSCDENIQSFKRSIQVFILEERKSEVDFLDCIKKYFNEYTKFLEEKDHKFKIFFSAFKRELTKPLHRKVLDLWNRSIKNVSLKQELKNEIKNDKLLNALYIRFNKQLTLQYDWEKCCKDKDVLKEYYNYIRGKGPLSKSYRELLAHLFNVNIRLYISDKNYDLSLRDNHNPSSKIAIHAVLISNEFIQYSIDENYLRLVEEREYSNILFNNILRDLQSCNKKQDFDDYLKKKLFLKQNISLQNEKKVDSEETEVEKIMEFFSDQKEQQLKTRLEKIKSQYIDQQKILHYILKRFCTEGRNISYEEFSYLINSILNSVVENRKELNIFCWITAAYNQRNWIDELLLLQLEDHFRSPLKEIRKWRKYLSKIENKYIVLSFGLKLSQGSKISYKFVGNTLRMLCIISTEKISLEGLELSDWHYTLKEKYWLSKLRRLTNWQESDQLTIAAYYLLSVENSFGTDLTEKFLNILEKKKQNLSSEELHNILSNFHNEKWILDKEGLRNLQSSNINEWSQFMQLKFINNSRERNFSDLVKIITSSANTSKKISKNLRAITDSNKNIYNENYIFNKKNVNCFTENDIKTWVKKKSGCNELNVTLLVINRAIQLKRGFKLRATQILTVIAFLTTDQSTLAQVSTGEGKTLIIVAISLIKLLRGEMVDIVTSSSVLAKRDSETNKDIYNLFGFDVSHNCSEDIEKRKEIYSCNQIVYGDLSNFQRDYLLDRFYGKNILGHHDFANIIVDEVDSMLLDKGNNMLYLTHDIADLDKLSSVFIYIWQWIKRPVKYSDDFISLFDTEAIKESVLNELYGYVKKEDIGNLGSDLSDQHKTIIWQRLVSADIIDNHGKLLKENINDSQLNEILLPEFITYKDRLNYLLIECIKRNTYIRVPNYLKSFVENHLDSWINNAITAFFMKAERDYVVDVDRSGTYADRNPIITIIDTDTGTDEVNSQWDEGLHQFLQLKHGCKITSQSLKAVFISNISFFKLYRTLYGLTGSLGSQRERDLLKEIHKVDFVTIPTAVPKQFQEYKPILCINKKEWITYIKQEVNKIIEENYRSVLIICETVHNVEVLYKAFGGRTARRVHKYVRDYEEFDVAQGKKELDQGQIIIATNLSGRGTDIKITKKLREAGGLHICLTYLPRNIRVEQQAFGRAARCGDRGSGQLIILDSYGTEKSIAKILDLKKERDINEVYRISNIKTYYDFQIYEEERCFNEFKKQFEELKKILSVQNVRSEIKEILLRSCLDQWTFWLDKNCHHIKMISDEQQKHNFYKRFDDFITKLKNFNSECSRNSSVHRRNYNENWFNWVDGNPVQMIKLGKYYSQNNEHKNSIKDAIRLFDDVIRMEPYFSEAAHYYKAFALTKCNRASSKEFEMELRIAAKLIDEHIRFVMITSGIINEIKENNNSIIRINAFREQQEITLKLYHIFLQSIDDIFGHNITPQSFSNYDINEELSEKIYKDLIKNKILSKMKVKHNISENDIDTICINYGISTDMLKSFLSKYVDINESAFLKDLKKEIKLPNKEEFWKLLMEKNVLIDDVQFIIVDIEKLNEIDPSLLDSLRSQNEFEQKSLDDNNGYVLFNTSVIPRTQRFITFKKDEFVKYVGKEKYKSLKKKRIFSFNRKSLLNIVNTKSITFPCYDSITPEDFNKININNNEAVNILTELCEQSVIEDIGNNIYRLKIKFYEIEQIKLRYCPVYENDVKTLLSLCFSYRIDFQKLEEQSQKNAPMCLQIMSKPHLNLFFDLIENKLIKCNTVITHNKDLEEKLKQIYKREMNKDDFMLLISQDKLIPDECKELLLNHLIKKNWLRSTPIGYNINTDDMRQKPLNFNAETTYKIQEIDKTVEKILDNELHLAKIETIQFIANTLKRLRSSLQSIIVPEYKLQSLSSLSELKSMEEMHHFSLNALDQILQIKDKKYTRNTICDIIIPIGTGICEVAAGYLIHIISRYQNTGNAFGNALIKEGLNDLTNGIYALLPRFFEWKLYTQCKLKNLFSSACAFGLKTLQKGANVAKFAYKIIKSNLGFNMKITNMSEEALIKTTALNLAEKKVTRLTAAKTIETVCHSFANVGIVLFMENCLRKLCEEMDTMILSTIEQEIEIELCNISENLEKLYNLLGQHKALNVINGLTNSFFNSQGNLEQFISITCNIAESVAHDVGKSVVETNKIHIMPKFSKSAVEKIMYKLKKSSHITNIRTITKNLLINLNQKIIDKLNEQIKEEELELLNQKLENFKCFEKEVVNQWKSMLREKVSQIIEKHIVSPISKKGVNHLIKHVRKNIQRVHTYYTEQGYSENFEQLKQICMKNLLQKADEAKEIEEQITEKYHKDLIKLLTKTKNPELYADMIEEGIPMDIACIGASTQIIKRLLKNNGYKKDIKIVIEENNGIKQEFFSLSEEQECITISLKLKDNYFNICKTNTSENDNSESKNNCLYEAVLKEFSPLKDAMSREQFRTEVIDCIKSDKEIRNYIRKGGHQTHSSLRPIDSGLQKSEKTENKDLSIALNEDIYDFEQYRYMRKKRNFYKHILRRFVRNCYLSQCHPKFAHFLSQVQNDTKCSNEWHGETESIDVFPSRNVNISTNTTYTESFTAEDATILKDIRDELKTTIKLFIANENVSDGDLEFWNIFLGDNSVKLLFGKNQNGSTDSTDK